MNAENYLGLRGQTAVVTGAGSQTSGIGNGRAASILLGQAGVNVVCADLQLERAKETADTIIQGGGKAVAVEADVSKLTDCEGIYSTAVDTFEGIDVLVNNVGIVGPPTTVIDIDLADWSSVYDVNVTSMLMMSRLCIPSMQQRGGGSIVNVSSIAGVLSHPRVAYATTKGAILSLTRSMASVHGPDGIRVNTVAPGMAYTPIAQVGGLTEEGRQQRAAASPLKTEGTGWDIGNAIVWLASQRAQWITGICLTVDGGYTNDIHMTDEMTFTKTKATK